MDLYCYIVYRTLIGFLDTYWELSCFNCGRRSLRHKKEYGLEGVANNGQITEGRLIIYNYSFSL